MKRKAKTPLFGTFHKALGLALGANQAKKPTDEFIEQTNQMSASRRRFLENTGKIALTGYLASMAANPLMARALRYSKIPPRIAIIGGGIAGLSALHTLKKAGLEATLYEASPRTGGRMFTVQGAMGEGTWAEFGAEFIDTNHKDMWDLANEFKLELIDYGQASEAALIKEAFFFEGRHRTLKELVDEFRHFADRIKADADRLPDNLSYKTKNKYIRKLDNMSLSEYLEHIGATGWVKRLIEVAYESEYGLAPDVQSAINLIILIGPDTTHGFEMFGESDERYKVRGGNQRIPDEIAKLYPDNIVTGRALESVELVGKEYRLTFDKMKKIGSFDYVIMAIPFSRLKNVNLGLELPKIKKKAIETIGFGTNTKLMLGMKSHFWRAQGYGGLCYSDNGLNNGWDNAQLQTPDNGPAGLSILFGGPGGVNVGNGTPESQKDIYLPKWEQIYKGATEQFSGKIARMHWPSHPFTLGSYICYTTGQYTSISGAEVMPVGNLLFAGEHCGGEFAGFMNGAAKSGREAAETILARLS